mgnify:FL=1
MALFFYKEKNKDIRAAAYLRLSIEDGDKAESNSIGNQRELIRDFAAERPGLHLVEEYADDGYTGTNFERPGFKRMMEDVQNPVYRAKGEIMSLTDKVSQMAKKREQLYADYVAGVVDSEDYQLIREDYSRQYDSLRAALQEAENKKVQVEQQIEEYLNMTSHLEEHLDNFEFDIHLVKTLVQRIEVSTDKRIRIVFGFRDIFAEAEKESAEK